MLKRSRISDNPKRKNQVVALKVPRRSSSSKIPGVQVVVRVDGKPWTQVSSFESLKPGDTCYMVVTDSDGNTSVKFGDGVNGSRLPEGSRISAVYRTGAGSSGNVSEKKDTTVAPFMDIVYLDVWQREVVVYEDIQLNDVADGGPDTTPRKQ